MHRVAAILSALALSGGAVSSAAAQVTLDVQQLSMTNSNGRFDRWVTQRFFPTMSYSGGAGLALSNQLQTGIDTGLLEIQLWDERPDMLGASMITSGTGAVAVARFQFGWFDVFWDAVAVTPGEDYYLAIMARGIQPYFGFSARNSYAGTHDLHRGCTVGSPVTDPYCLATSISHEFDLTFRTYSADPPLPTATPEPATIVLVGSGLAALKALRRRRSPFIPTES